MDFLFNSSLTMFKYEVVEDEEDNVVQHIPACDKKPKFELELIMQTTMSLGEIKALEGSGEVKVFFTLNYFKYSFFMQTKTNPINDFAGNVSYLPR